MALSAYTTNSQKTSSQSKAQKNHPEFYDLRYVYLCDNDSGLADRYRFGNSTFKCKPGRFSGSHPTYKNIDDCERNFCGYKIDQRVFPLNNRIVLSGSDCTDNVYTHYYWPEQKSFINGKYENDKLQFVFLFKNEDPDLQFDEVEDLMPLRSEAVYEDGKQFDYEKIFSVVEECEQMLASAGINVEDLKISRGNVDRNSELMKFSSMVSLKPLDEERLV